MNEFTILEIQISVILENLINSFGGEKEVSVKKDEDHYRLNIIVSGEQIGSITINGKGLDSEEYFMELLDISCEYLKNGFNR